MSRAEPQWLIDDAKRAFPDATLIDLSFSTESSFEWMKVKTNGQEFNSIGCEHNWRLTVQEGAKVVACHHGQTLNQVRDKLDAIFAENT